MLPIATSFIPDVALPGVVPILGSMVMLLLAAGAASVLPATRAARIDVIDSGIGIAPEMRERVFDEFVQGAPAPRQAATGRGMGLGLAIVRRLAALLDHPLELASVPGQGSRFSVAVPRVPPRRHRPDERTSSLAPPDAHPATLSFAGRCIAVIDDDPSVVAAYEDLADAFEVYDAALYDAYGEMTPLDIYSGDDDEDDDDSDEDDVTDGDELDDHDDEDGDGPRLYAGLDDDVDFDDDTDENDDRPRR